MKLKTLVSPIALVTAISLSSAAYAQLTVGGQGISDADMELVENHCATLADPASDSDAVTDDAAEMDEPAENTADDELEAEITDPGIDLEAITLEDCQAAGLVR